MKKLVLLMAFFLLAAAPLCADTIYFTDGTYARGTISKQTSEYVSLEQSINPAITQIIEYPKSKIAKIEIGGSEEIITPLVQDRFDVERETFELEEVPLVNVLGADLRIKASTPFGERFFEEGRLQIGLEF